LEAKSLVMMVAMMLPSLVPMLWRYRRAVGATGAAKSGTDHGFPAQRQY
jgi:predicted metal-binding membrane protein